MKSHPLTSRLQTKHTEEESGRDGGTGPPHVPQARLPVMSRLRCAVPQPPATPRPVPVFTGRAGDPEKSWVTLGLHSDGGSPSQGHQAAERGKTFYCET